MLAAPKNVTLYNQPVATFSVTPVISATALLNQIISVLLISTTDAPVLSRREAGIFGDHGSRGETSVRKFSSFLCSLDSISRV